jgi:hypothetical protein
VVTNSVFFLHWIEGRSTIAATTTTRSTFVLAAMLPYEGQIRFGQGVQANQFRFVFGSGEQFQAFGGGQDLSAGHG